MSRLTKRRKYSFVVAVVSRVYMNSLITPPFLLLFLILSFLFIVTITINEHDFYLRTTYSL